MTEYASLLCQSCGTWTRSVTTCPSCGCSTLAASHSLGRVHETTGVAQNAAAIRVLVDVEEREDGTVHATRLYSARLASLRDDRDLLSQIHALTHEQLRKRTNDRHSWVGLRQAVTPLIAQRLEALLKPRWPGGTTWSSPHVEVHFRLLILHVRALPSIDAPPWVEVCSLNDAAKRNGAAIQSVDELSPDLRGTSLSLEEGGDRIQLVLRVPKELLVERLVLYSAASNYTVIHKFDRRLLLQQRQLNSLLDERLPASVLWSLAPIDEGQRVAAQVAVYVIGAKTQPFYYDVPCGNLGKKAHVVDLFLDLGSTSTKFFIRIDGMLEKALEKRTSRLMADWQLPAYEKARILNDASGKAWAEWVSQLAGALRRYVAHTFDGYLGSLHLTLPQSGALDVSALAVAVNHANQNDEVRRGFDSRAVQRLRDCAAYDFVQQHTSKPTILLTAEADALAAHYLAPLDALQKAAKQYGLEHAKRAATARQEHQLRVQEWQKKYEKWHKHEKRNFLAKLFVRRPENPGQSPEQAEVESPADWVLRLAKTPDYIDRVVILDAGGLTLDVAVIERGQVSKSNCTSHGSCGGEAVSREFAVLCGQPGMPADDLFREKAGLGDKWFPDRETTPRQVAYKLATERVYRKYVDEAAARLVKLWSASKTNACTVLLTGGGSRNPHFEELVIDAFQKAGFVHVDVRDARALAILLEEARQLAPNINELNGATVAQFEETLRWAQQEMRGSERAAYDRYAIVGGMIAQSKQRGAHL